VSVIVLCLAALADGYPSRKLAKALPSVVLLLFRPDDDVNSLSNWKFPEESPGFRR
jgi:hypothetical protein